MVTFFNLPFISTLIVFTINSLHVASFPLYHSSRNIQRRINANELREVQNNKYSYGPYSSKEITRLKASDLTDINFVPNVLEEVSSAYSYALAHYQLQTQSLSTGVLSGVGDTIAQCIEKSEDEKERKIQLQRTFNFVLKGFGAGLIWHAWYNIADLCGDMAFGSDHDTAKVQRTLLCISLEQFVACPIVYTLWDIPIPALLSGSTLKEIPGRIQGRLGDLLFSNAKVWTLANMIIYNIPLDWRVLAMNFADLGWQVIASKSIMADNDLNTPDEKMS